VVLFLNGQKGAELFKRGASSYGPMVKYFRICY
jgi:hypothetical protein